MFTGEPVHVKQFAQGAILWKLSTVADQTSTLHLYTNGHSRKSWLIYSEVVSPGGVEVRGR